MSKYIVNMEFTGHHEIEFNAESDEQAVQMVEDGDELYLDSNLYEHISEECLPIGLVAIRNEDSAIKNNLGMEGEEEIWTI